MTTHVKDTVLPNTSGTNTFTASVTSTAGHTLVLGFTAWMTANTPVHITNITDSAGNTWVFSTSTANQNPPANGSYSTNFNQYGFTLVATCIGAAAITSVTVTTSASVTSFAEGAVSEFSSLPAGAVVLGGASSGTLAALATSYTTPSVSAPSSGAVLVVVYTSNFGGWTGVTSGYTILSVSDPLAAYNVAATAGTISVTLTQSTGADVPSSAVVVIGAPSGASVSGVVAASALAAPAGSVNVSAAVSGAVAPLALAAHAGSVAVGIGPAGAVAPLALAAPAGSVRVSAAVAGPVAALSLAAPGGSVTGNPLVFPEIPLGLTAELQVNGTWTSVTGYMDHGPVAIGRGHPDESTTVSPSTVEMTLTNTTGEFTSQNPVSSLYPWLKPNIPLRVSIPAATSYLRSEADAVSGASCPDASGLHVTGDLDIRLDLQLTDYGSHDLMFKWAVSNQGWFLQLNGGVPQFFWSTTGSDFPSALSTVPLPFGLLTLRVTLAVSTGTVTFWTGPAGNADSSSGWTQLGAASVSGATSVFASTAGIETAGWFGAVFEAEVRNGIGGTVVAHPVFSAQAAGATSFTDAQSNTWTVFGTAEISGRDYRGHFEVPEFPQEEPPYDPDTGTSEPDVLCAISGGGLLRRLGQANTPMLSPMRRAYVKLSTTAQASAPVAYWPMEDLASATQLASGLGGTAMGFNGSPTLASSTAFACSAALPVTNGASFAGRVPAVASWTANVARFLMAVPSGGEANGAVLASMWTTGTIARLDLVYGTGGTGAFTLNGYSSAGAQLFTTGAFFPDDAVVNGGLLRVSMELQPSGSSVQYGLATLAPGAALAGDETGTLASSSVGAVTEVILNPNGTLTGTAFGHCSVQPVWDTLFDLSGPLDAWLGEPAGTRFQRLCGEEGIQFRGRGIMAATTLMGVQSIETLTQLLQECADADRGVWYELREQLGWGYVTRAALYNQPAALTLDHDQDHLSPWTSDPTQDDQTLLNDATITATDGSSARAYAAPGQPVTGGRLNNQKPPAGIGVYDSVPTSSVNTYRDSDLQQIASWMIHLGTVDVQRFPGISIDLANTAYPYFAQTVAMDLGDRLVIDNPPPWLGFDPVSQLCQGLKETLWAFDYLIEVNGVPETPYEVAQAGIAHAGTAGSQLTSGVSSTATSLSVTTTAGNIWTTSGGDFPFDVMIAGERMTVTNITGSSSPQTFTVTRSVNGVVKAQLSAAAVQVYTRPVAAL